ARNAIQLVAPTKCGGALLICGVGHTRDIAWARAEALRRASNRVLVAELNPNRKTVTLSDTRQGLPQGLELTTGCGARSQFLTYIRDQKFDRIEIADPPAVPIGLARDLLAFDIPLDFFMANGGLLCPRGTFSRERSRHCGIPTDARVCDACVARLGATASLRTDVGSWRREWRAILEKCRTIWVPDADPFALFALMFPPLRDRVQLSSETTAVPHAPHVGGRRPRPPPLGQLARWSCFR